MDWIAELTDLTRGFSAELASGDLRAPVPSCPGWTLADLGEHLRKVHLWAAHAVSDGTMDGMPDDTTAARPGMSADQLVEGYPAAAAHLIEVLTGAAPEDPAWTFGRDQTSGFWRRRQTHEALVHLYDAMLANGTTTTWGPSPELAWDGVDEVATLWYPFQLRLKRAGSLAAPLRLIATDIDRSLTLSEESAGNAVELALPAADLLLTLWNRMPVADPAAAQLLADAALVA